MDLMGALLKTGVNSTEAFMNLRKQYEAKFPLFLNSMNVKNQTLPRTSQYQKTLVI